MHFLYFPVNSILPLSPWTAPDYPFNTKLPSAYHLQLREAEPSAPLRSNLALPHSQPDHPTTHTTQFKLKLTTSRLRRESPRAKIASLS
jgi:hypothetical protein